MQRLATAYMSQPPRRSRKWASSREMKRKRLEMLNLQQRKDDEETAISRHRASPLSDVPHVR